jgi:hypothetical protein
MGCDIHISIEFKTEGSWKTYAVNRNWFRSYYFFGLIAGVRGETCTPIAQPRGLPDDVTEAVLFASKWDHFHHRTWLTVPEWRQCLRNMYILFLESMGPRFQWQLDSGGTKRGDICRGLDPQENWIDRYGQTGMLSSVESEQIGYFFGNDVSAFVPSNEIEDVRLVIWFDN